MAELSKTKFSNMEQGIFSALSIGILGSNNKQILDSGFIFS